MSPPQKENAPRAGKNQERTPQEEEKRDSSIFGTVSMVAATAVIAWSLANLSQPFALLELSAAAGLLAHQTERKGGRDNA